MALPTRVDTQDAIPAGMAEHYVEVEGGGGQWALAVESTDGRSLADVTGLTQGISRERDAAARHRRALAPWEELGESADSVRGLLEKLSDLEAAGEGKGGKPDPEELQRRVDAATKALAAKHTKELEASQASTTFFEAEARRQMVDGAAAVALAEAGLRGPGLELLLPHIQQRATVVRDDGADHLRVRINGDDGSERLQVDGSTTRSMTIAELVAEMKTDERYQMAFPGSGTTGGGTRTTTGGRHGRVSISSADAKDHSKYLVARKAAIDAGQGAPDII